METMQEYVTTGLQNLAYSLTMATQKVNIGPKVSQQMTLLEQP